MSDHIQAISHALTYAPCQCFGASDGRVICNRCRALTAITALQEERERMWQLLANIVLNAVVIPDPAMKGLTDTYSVPLDDIEAARAAMEPAPQEGTPISEDPAVKEWVAKEGRS